VSKAEYVEHGSEALTAKLADDLRQQGRNPYVVPVGGSNSLGCWGYIMAMEEIIQQTQGQPPFTHILVVRTPPQHRYRQAWALPVAFAKKHWPQRHVNLCS
jgi:1-aminocyclopropane-1-carboxylate deaminase/D-cysteine desulfhydrase-like pyridoxal-dependent ACC family enzyme